MNSREIFTLRKQGRSAEALQIAREAYPGNENDLWLLRAYAWSMYDHVKSIIDRCEAKKISPYTIGSRLSPLMREFLHIANPLRSDSVFSHMNRLALKSSRYWPDFLGYARWVGADNFTGEDKKPFVTQEGKIVESFYKRYIRAICRETAAKATDKQTRPQWIEWGSQILKRSLKIEPNDLWFNYYQSKLHLAQGQPDLALQRLIPVLLQHSTAAWPWGLLGDIFETTRPEDTLICYAYATQLARKEIEVAKIRIQLAQRLALVERYNEAANQAWLAIQYRKINGYRIPQGLQNILANNWYHDAVANNTLQPLPPMHSVACKILQELHRQRLTYTRGVIDQNHSTNALTFLATGTESGIGLWNKKFPEIAKLPSGTVIEIGRRETDGPPLDWKISELQEITGLCQAFSGTVIRQADKDFAFVRCELGDVFVPPELAKNFDPVQQYNVKGKAMRKINKQGKSCWSAIHCILQDLYINQAL